MNKTIVKMLGILLIIGSISCTQSNAQSIEYNKEQIINRIEVLEAKQIQSDKTYDTLKVLIKDVHEDIKQIIIDLKE